MQISLARIETSAVVAEGTHGQMHMGMGLVHMLREGEVVLSVEGL